MLSVIMPNVVMLSFFMLSVIMLNVVMLNVFKLKAAPNLYLKKQIELNEHRAGTPIITTRKGRGRREKQTKIRP